MLQVVRFVYGMANEDFAGFVPRQQITGGMYVVCMYVFVCIVRTSDHNYTSLTGSSFVNTHLGGILGPY